MAQLIHEYPEVVGKTVEKVTVVNESDWRNISIKFTDKTALHITVRSRLTMEPELIDWKSGDMKTMRSYPHVHEKEG